MFEYVSLTLKSYPAIPKMLIGKKEIFDQLKVNLLMTIYSFPMFLTADKGTSVFYLSKFSVLSILIFKILEQIFASLP